MYDDIYSLACAQRVILAVKVLHLLAEGRSSDLRGRRRSMLEARCCLVEAPECCAEHLDLVGDPGRLSVSSPGRRGKIDIGGVILDSRPVNTAQRVQ